MTPHDRALATRALALSALLAAIALVVILATDEPSSTPHDRLARLAAIAPALAGLAVTLASARSARRGELLALAASGVSQSRALAAAALAATLPGLALAAAIAAGAGRLDALFPRLDGAPLHADAGRFLAPASGVVLDAGLAVTFGVADPASTTGPARALVALALALATAMVAAWAATARTQRLVVAAAAAFFAIVAFHLVAQGAHASVLFAPHAALALHALAQRRRA